MFIILKPKTTEREVEDLTSKIQEQGVNVSSSEWSGCNILSLESNIGAVNSSELEFDPNVECIIKVKDAYKKTTRKSQAENTVINITSNTIGGDLFALIAGPCSVESESQILGIAKSLKTSGAKFLRGGVFKPRTSPYSFQGMGLEGLELMKKAKEITGLPIVAEIMSTKLVDLYVKDVDIIQVGARNMQNFDMLKELGKTKTPILLKRGLSATIEELLMSAEYILAGGNPNVILCERGIRTFETYTRNTLDISAVPILKRITHLPVVVDPSHASGINWLIEPLSMAAMAAGADGLMIEVHNDPCNAKCDGSQSLTPSQFDLLAQKLRKMVEVFGKKM